MTRIVRRFRPTLWASVFALPMVAVLFGLGVWQLERLQWKETLLAEIDERAFGEPIPLPITISEPEKWNYQRVLVEGTFAHDREIHLLANKGAGFVGYEVVTPLRRDDGSYVFIDRGWVPAELKDADARPQGQVTGAQIIVGVARISQDKPWAVPANKPEEGIWFYGNIPEMEAYLGIEAAPVFVQADGTPNPGGWPQGGQTRVDIPNNHLGYALTWFGLAIALAVIYVLYHWQRDESQHKGR